MTDHMTTATACVRVLARYADTIGSVADDQYADTIEGWDAAFRRAGEIRAADPRVPIEVARRDANGHWTHWIDVARVPLGVCRGCSRCDDDGWPLLPNDRHAIR